MLFLAFCFWYVQGNWVKQNKARRLDPKPPQAADKQRPSNPSQGPSEEGIISLVVLPATSQIHLPNIHPAAIALYTRDLHSLGPMY